jgi:predicted DNA-binding transcriptional regulator AlpA
MDNAETLETAAASTPVQELAQVLAPIVAELVVEKMRLDQIAGDDLILSTPDAAKLVGVAERTLENWRADNSGPPFIKIGTRNVGYRLGALREWISSRPARGRRALDAGLHLIAP